MALLDEVLRGAIVEEGDLFWRWAMKEDRRIDRLQFAQLHRVAISALAEAEVYLCRIRADCLFKLADRLTEEAMAPGFFARLARLEGRLRVKGNKGPRRPERDDSIRFTFLLLRGLIYGGAGSRWALSYGGALTETACRFKLSEKAVETIIGSSKSFFDEIQEITVDDHTKLREYLDRHFPEKP